MSLLTLPRRRIDLENRKDSKINVFSEIGNLREVLVHRPGREIELISPFRLDELLFSALLEPETARREHDNFTNILKAEGVKVIELVDLTAETFAVCSEEERNKFVEDFLDESNPVLSDENRKLVKEFLVNQKSIKNMIEYMMGGILSSDLGLKDKPYIVCDPMPNLYFTRDPFASVGNGTTMHLMKYRVRQRETLFSRLIFTYHPIYKETSRFFEPTGNEVAVENTYQDLTIEGGDVFIYNDSTLVVGVSERTKLDSINKFAQRLKTQNTSFTRMYAINVPHLPNLMHLDTWLTMLDKDKFLYSPNMLDVLKIWRFDLEGESVKYEEVNYTLEQLLEEIIGKKPILVPVAGENANSIEIDVETNFDATNYLVIRPGVVVGYDRNVKTQAALEKAGITVLPFLGNQLSLGMGSARCMSMPLVRDKVK